MKKNILIIIVIALVCFSCGRERRGQLTQRGKEIHDSWNWVTIQIVQNDIIPAFHLDAWISAATDSARYAIEDKFFPYQRIRQEEANVYAIYNGTYKTLTINTFGQSLNDEGSHWLVSKYNEYYYNYSTRPLFLTYEEGEKLHISKNGDQWLIQMDSSENRGSFCRLNIKPLDNNGDIPFTKNKFTLSGNGLYKYVEGPVYLSFDIQRPILNDKIPYAEGYYFVDGIVQFLAQYNNFDDISVKAEYLGTSQIAITYKNVTEYWNSTNLW
ncbi:MAG: hypothetical protein J6X01_00705 [Bacteroidales bacterium]|nr:hypothetical protein [Bacteroidales bacterium]